MKNTALKTQNAKTEPVLRSIFLKAEAEYLQIEHMFNLLGWGDLPGELKFEIEEDVKGYVDELNGNYSTFCPFVQKRRERVDFWVNSLLDGLCTTETAVEALKVKSL
ncbi:MAG: hypothetical protein WEA56_01925 [Balneolaceae bacterium]